MRYSEHTTESIGKAVARMEIVGPAGYYHRDSVDDYVDLGELETEKNILCACGLTFKYDDCHRKHVWYECELANE